MVGVCLVWSASGIGQSERRSPADPYQTCQSLWEELRQLREKGADDSSWSDFTVRGRDQLAPIVAQLEGEASSKNRIGQLLLWASRDCLPKMFSDARTEPSSSETLLAEYLENVERLQKGERVYRTSPAGPRFQAKSSFDWFKTDPITALISVFFTLSNVVVVSWLFWVVRHR